MVSGSSRRMSFSTVGSRNRALQGEHLRIEEQFQQNRRRVAQTLSDAFGHPVYIALTRSNSSSGFGTVEIGVPPNFPTALYNALHSKASQLVKGIASRVHIVLSP